MKLSEVHKEFKGTLPSRSDFRSTSAIPFREIIKEYRSWGRFVLAYEQYAKEEIARLAILKVKKKEVKRGAKA